MDRPRRRTSNPTGLRPTPETRSDVHRRNLRNACVHKCTEKSVVPVPSLQIWTHFWNLCPLGGRTVRRSRGHRHRPTPNSATRTDVHRRKFRKVCAHQWMEISVVTVPSLQTEAHFRCACTRLREKFVLGRRYGPRPTELPRRPTSTTWSDAHRQKFRKVCAHKCTEKSVVPVPAVFRPRRFFSGRALAFGKWSPVVGAVGLGRRRGHVAGPRLFPAQPSCRRCWWCTPIDCHCRLGPCMVEAFFQFL